MLNQKNTDMEKVIIYIADNELHTVQSTFDFEYTLVYGDVTNRGIILDKVYEGEKPEIIPAGLVNIMWNKK